MKKKAEEKSQAIEIIPGGDSGRRVGHLFWICGKKPPQSHKEAYYFSVDEASNEA
jgi:hypothetical protein